MNSTINTLPAACIYIMYVLTDALFPA